MNEKNLIELILEKDFMNMDPEERSVASSILLYFNKRNLLPILNGKEELEEIYTHFGNGIDKNTFCMYGEIFLEKLTHVPYYPFIIREINVKKEKKTGFGEEFYWGKSYDNIDLEPILKKINQSYNELA